MDVDHVAFAALRKFDGRRARWLYPQEIGQIAGRAGRFRRDGTFGVTGDAPELDPDVIAAVEGHVFPPRRGGRVAQRAAGFPLARRPDALARRAAADGGLQTQRGSQDETTLRQLATDETVIRRCRDRANLMRLWEACQTPDFRKATQDEHTRLIGAMFEHLTQGDRRLPEDWMQGQFASLDRLDGDIDALSARLARVRTLAYVANRADWLADPAGLAGPRARAGGPALRHAAPTPDAALHRPAHQRAAAQSRANAPARVLGGIGADGAVTVEGHASARSPASHFEPERGATALENRALRGAVERAVAPEIARRLGELAGDDDEAFALAPDGAVIVARLPGGRDRRRPAVCAARAPRSAISAPEPARERAARRLEAFVAAESSRRLAPLKRLKGAIADGRLKGLARGLAYQLVEQFGVVDRRRREAQLRALSRAERRALKASACASAPSASICRLCWRPRRARSARSSPNWRGPAGAGADALTRACRIRRRRPRLSRCAALRAVAGFAAPVSALERLDALARAATPQGGGAVELTPQLLADLGWRPGQAEAILRAPRLRAARARRARRTRICGGGGRLGQGAGAPPAPSRPSPRWRRSSGRRLRRRAAPVQKRRRRAAVARRRPVTSEPAEACRVDVWLWRARFFKTRSLAARVVEEGGVRLTRGGVGVAAGQAEPRGARRRRPGLSRGARWMAVRIEALGARRGPASEARALYRLLDDPAGGPPGRPLARLQPCGRL